MWGGGRALELSHTRLAMVVVFRKLHLVQILASNTVGLRHQIDYLLLPRDRCLAEGREADNETHTELLPPRPFPLSS